MKYLITLLALFFTTSFSFAQTQQEDSVDYYISNLNWSSVTVSTTYVPKLIFDVNSLRLIALKGSSIEKKLYKKIGDKERTLAIHAILTSRYHKPTSLSQLGNYEKDTLVGLYFTYNHLKWYYELNSGESSIDDEAVKYAQSYWRKKIKKKKRK
jgi:hypothetical protein